MNPVDIHAQLRARRVISLVGGGGKTTLMFRLAQLLQAAGRRVLTTTTTKIATPRRHQTGALITARSAGGRLLERLAEAFSVHHHLTLVEGQLPAQGKLQGIDRDLIGLLLEAQVCDHILVEADGAARRSLKAPASHEPVLPLQTDLLIAVAGLDVVGKPLDAAHVHRPMEVARITGLGPGEPIRPEDLAALIAHPQGLLKGRPVAAVCWAFLNKADQPRALARGRKVAAALSCAPARGLSWLILGTAARERWICESYPFPDPRPAHTLEAGP